MACPEPQPHLTPGFRAPLDSCHGAGSALSGCGRPVSVRSEDVLWQSQGGSVWTGGPIPAVAFPVGTHLRSSSCWARPGSGCRGH